MASTILSNVQTQKPLVDAFREIEIFADLTAEEMAWLVEHSSDETFEPGIQVIHEGDPAEYMIIILQGGVRFQPKSQETPVLIGGAGRVTGMLPFSRLTHYAGNGYATSALRVARIHKDHFPEMLARIPSLGQSLVATMADRIRESANLSQQRDKLQALGKLSAGLAHELNNPASAARHSAVALRDSFQDLNAANMRLAQLRATPEQNRCISEFERTAQEQMASAVQLDSLERSDREEALSKWLDSKNVEHPWQLAPSLVDAGFDVDQLETIADRFQSGMLEPVLARVCATLSIERLIQSIDHSTGQIASLVQSIKEYTYMDQAPEQEVDIHRGLENTLTMLGHCLKSGVQVIKDYDMSLPKVCAWGSELNQVWTNVIDNALDAMGGRGILRLRTTREIDMALIEVRDTGSGIPEHLKHRIFEPFFSTKEVGAGTRSWSRHGIPDHPEASRRHPIYIKTGRHKLLRPPSICSAFRVAGSRLSSVACFSKAGPISASSSSKPSMGLPRQVSRGLAVGLAPLGLADRHRSFCDPGRSARRVERRQRSRHLSCL